MLLHTGKGLAAKSNAAISCQTCHLEKQASETDLMLK